MNPTACLVVTASPEQAALLATIGDLYGADAGAVLLALGLDRLESAPVFDPEYAMPLLLWEFAGAYTVPQVDPQWDFKHEASAAVPDSA